MENGIQIAVQQTKAIETLLAQKFSAVGGGLTQKVKSIEYYLDAELVKEIKEVARIRNNVVHQDGSALDDPDGYIEKCRKILATLNKTEPFKLELKSLLEITAPCELLQKEEQPIEVAKAEDIQDAEPSNKKSGNGCLIAIVGLAILGIGFSGMGLYFLPVIVLLALVYFIANGFGIKDSGVEPVVRSGQTKWSFYVDRFIVSSPGFVDIEHFYDDVRFIKLIDTQSILIKVLDRGVPIEFILNTIRCSEMSTAEICQKIHSLVFPVTPRVKLSSDAAEDKTAMAVGTATTLAAMSIGISNSEDDYVDSSDDSQAIASASEYAQSIETDSDVSHPIESDSDFFQPNASYSGYIQPETSDLDNAINPANGLPMVGAVDIEGNPYGADFHSLEDTVALSSHDATSGFDDSFTSHDDTFSSTDDFSTDDSWNSSI